MFVLLDPSNPELRRTIPIEAAIQNETRKVKYEEVSYWLDKVGKILNNINNTKTRVNLARVFVAFRLKRYPFIYIIM